MVGFSPLTLILPSVGVSRPPRHCRRVVFPEPLCPRRAIKDPADAVKLMFSHRVFCGYLNPKSVTIKELPVFIIFSFSDL